ncbi:MAG: hypothetical protein AAGJ40_11640 [Planctomycetota bacterium]
MKTGGIRFSPSTRAESALESRFPYIELLSNRLVHLGWVLACVVIAAGCRGRGQQDLYAQKLRQEVRVLEDQLYDADYENRVLIDKLRRAKAARDEWEAKYRDSGRSEDAPVRDTDDPAPAAPDPTPSDSFDLGNGFDEPSISDSFKQRGADAKTTNEIESIPLGDGRPNGATDGDLPTPLKDSPSPKTPSSENDDFPDLDSLVDPGQLVTPGELVTPEPLSGSSDNATTPGENRLMLPPGTGRSTDAPQNFDLPEPPIVPEPPGPSDQRLGPIDPGEALPPNSINGRPDGPPGQIPFPPGLGMLGGLGTVAGAGPKIVLHTHQVEIDVSASQVRLRRSAANQPERPKSAEASPIGNRITTDGIDVVLSGLDQYGQPIGFLSRTVNPTSRLTSSDNPVPRPTPDPSAPAQLSVVALDPSQTGESAKIGRWNFDADMIDQMQSQSNLPMGRLRVPIRWQEKRPQGDRVIIFVRYEEGTRDLRCDAELVLKPQASVAGWLPRH